MKRKMVPWTGIIRMIFTVALLYGVYTETGKWTAVFAALMALYTELASRIIIKTKKKETS